MRRLLLVLALCSGCAARSELLVVISTDLTLPDEADRLSITVTYPERAGELAFHHEYGVPGEATLPASIDLASSVSPPPAVEIAVSLAKSGKTVVERRAVVSLQQGRSLLLRLPLERSCVAHSPCSPSETCARGGCRPVAVDPGELTDVPPDPLTPPDLGGCPDPGVPPAYNGDGGCITYRFENGIPDAFTVVNPGSVTLTTDCKMLRFQVPGGPDHDFWFKAVDAPRIETVGSYSGPFRIAARYYATFDTEDKFAGVYAAGIPGRYAFEVEGFYNNRLYEELDIFTLGTPPLTNSVPAVAGNPHVPVLERTNHDLNLSTFHFLSTSRNIDAVQVVDFPRDARLGFTVGNSAVFGPMTAPAVDVRLEWLQICVE